MRQKTKDKRYIYIRDNKQCYFCNKELLFKQISLDHYLPRSKGGPDDIFNLVLSCKRCNKLKKSSIPEDYKDIMINLFKKGVKDRKIIAAGIGIKQKELMDIIEDVFRIEDIGEEYTVFQSYNYRFYIKQNKIYKIIHMDISHIEREV